MREQLGHVATSSPFSKSSYKKIKQHVVSRPLAISFFQTSSTPQAILLVIASTLQESSGGLTYFPLH